MNSEAPSTATTRSSNAARAALEAARQQLYEALMQVPAIVNVFRGPQHHFDFVNARWIAALGHSDVLGKPVREAQPELAGTGFFELLDQVYASGEAFNGIEVPVPREAFASASGETAFFNFIYQPIRDAAGVVNGILGYAVDVTEQVRARQRLEATATENRQLYDAARVALARLESVLATAPVGLAFWNSELRYTHVNEFLAAINGLPAAAHIGHTIGELLPDLPTDVERMLRQVLETGAAIREVEVHGFTPAVPGSERAWLTSYYPVRSPDGAVREVGAVVLEITARKRIELDRTLLAEASVALAASLDTEATLQTVARLAIPRIADYAAVFLADHEQQARAVAVAHRDPTREALLWELQQRYIATANTPTSPTSITLRTGKAVLVEELRPDLIDLLPTDEEIKGLMRQLGTRSVITAPLTAHGATIGVLMLAFTESGRCYSNDDLQLASELARRCALAIDNARLYATERAARAEAEAAVQLRETFLSIAAHELKTPLTALLGHAHLLQRRAVREGSIGERDRRTVDIMVAQGERLNAMIVAMLDVTRLKQGHLAIEREPVDLGALTRRVIDELRPLLHRHTLVLEAEDLPLVVRGDALRLEQVLQNLLSNAIKYSPHGGPIQVTLARHDTLARLVVHDVGIGIPADALPLLFQRFYRAVNVDPQQISGIGVGLYLVKEIVALHDGDVEVQSREGQGSTFIVTLPLLGA